MSKMRWISLTLLFLSSAAMAAPLSLETTPLFTTNSVKPNLILAIDDSGSMDSEVLFLSNDGALWWNTTDKRFASSGVINYNTSGSANSTWKKFTYLFPNGTGAGSGKRVYADSTHNHYAIPPLKQYAFSRSNLYNNMYYDPNTTYEPWADYGATTFSNVSSTAAPADPISGTGTTLDLLSDSYKTGSNETFKMYDGMIIPTGTYYDGATLGADLNITSTTDAKIRYYPATYYINKSSGAFTVGTGGSSALGDCASPDASLYTTFTNDPSSLSGTDVDSLGPDGNCLQKIEIKSATTSYANSGTRTDCATAANCSYDEEKQNFANWYSYYRKRHIALRGGMGQAFVGFNAIRTGIFTINNRSNVTMWDMNSDSNSFYSTLYNIDGNSGGTPNRQAMDYAGKQFMRTDAAAPIIEACQKNFTLFFTDGFSTLKTGLAGNEDGGQGSPYQDSYSGTISDITMKYYNTNLRTGTGFPAGDVPPALGCSVTPLDPQLDCQTNLHMNTYTVGLGATGTIFNFSHFDVADAYATPPTWPNVGAARDASQVDDLYHAAVNGRGEMFNAASASDLQDQLKSALLGIQASIGSASAVTFNTSTLETNSALYFAFFNSANWSGDLVSFPLDSNGDVDLTEAWSAATILDSGSPVSNSTRKIITSNGSMGVPFRWDPSKLSTAQQNDLSVSINGVSNGQNLLDYIRGDRTNEGPGNYRVRSSILGDIVSSNPVFVGVPNLAWPSAAPFPSTVGSRYSDFRSSLLTTPRSEVVYVGANDGMLHGFDAVGGYERIAYIPNYLSSTVTTSGLHYLANPLYSHNYYVDLAPTASDVYIDTGSGDQWHSILIGGSRAGGRGLFALDITNPSTFSEANADDIALWEFTDPDLGYTYSKPTIAMIGSGANPSTAKWAAIFGNGYNDTGTGEAQLFIVYLEGGLDGIWTPSTDYVKISTGVGSTTTPNGLATPVILDTNNNGVADRAYAGDLQGNLWAFDLTTNTVAYTSSGTPAPLFIAKDASGNRQPITSKPTASFHPSSSGSNDPDLLIFFGTGKYLETSDLVTTDQQTFYGVWDHGSQALERADLVAQIIDNTTYTDADGNPLRLISDNSVDYSTKSGWYIDFPTTGERLVVEPQIRGSLVFFNTWIPSSSACDSGGTGFLMSVETLNGGEPDAIAFNTDGISGITDADYITDANGNLRAAAGQSFDNGLPARSSFLGNKQYTTGTGDIVIEVRDVQQISGPSGRFSWKEIR
jgi:type IV pilus assembly protein PilY1